MAELETVLLGSLLADDKAIAVGVMYPGEDTPSGVPLIRVADIIGGRVSTKVGYRISEEVNSQYRRTQLSGNEVLMTLVGRPGIAIKVPHEIKGWNAARALAVLRLAEPADRDFFVYSVASPQVQHTIRNWCNTTVQATLNLKEIKALPLPWPEAPKRHAIAATLGALDDKIELNRRMNETLEAMARALFRDWFVDFGPTRAKMAGTAPYLSPDLWSLFPDSLDDAGKPEGWEERPIRENCSRVANGGTPKRDVAEYWNDGDIPWLSSGEVRQKLILETISCITSKGLQESSAKLVDSGSTVVALYGATAGQVSYLARQVTTNQAVCSLTPKPGFRAYNFLKLASETETLLGMATGSAQQNLSKALVENFFVLVANSAIMNAFEKTVAPWLEKMIANEQESRTLAQTRDLLLPRLMSGELRVAEAERAAEAVL
jgi:type I restriction enzyme S subunit